MNDYISYPAVVHFEKSRLVGGKFVRSVRTGEDGIGTIQARSVGVRVPTEKGTILFPWHTIMAVEE